MKQTTISASMKVNNTYYIGLGSNLGDRKTNLSTAIKFIKTFAKIIKKSSIYETEPVGYKKQNNFLNMVASVSTKFAPIELTEKLRKIEKNMGRTRRIKNGPRIIDIDILLCNKEIIDLRSLKIPHPRMHKRNFVLTPLSEIAPNSIHPKYKKNMRTLLASLKNPEKITLWTKKR